MALFLKEQVWKLRICFRWASRDHSHKGFEAGGSDVSNLFSYHHTIRPLQGGYTLSCLGRALRKCGWCKMQQHACWLVGERHYSPMDLGLAIFHPGDVFSIEKVQAAG